MWNVADQPVQDVMDSQFNEVALDYNVGFTSSLAWLTARGLSSGTELPEAEFPPQDERNQDADLKTTDREFFMTARRLSEDATATEIEATVWNRSRWPARVTSHLSFRNYFTLDGQVGAKQVRATVSGAESARLSAVRQGTDKSAFVEISFPDDAIHPGSPKAAQRTVKLRLSAPQWACGNDWSNTNLTGQSQLQPHLPVYD